MGKKKSAKKEQQAPANPEEEMLKRMPAAVQERFKKAKPKLDKLKKKVLEKFDKYISGIALLPPPRPKPGAAPDPAEEKKLHTLVLVDDSDSKKMSKLELKDKLSVIIEKEAKDIDKDIVPQTVILSELWQNCFDGKFDLLQMIALAAPVYDTGMLAAVKIAEVHKSMVLKKFEKYIVSYVLAGSLVQGKATHTSDIDVWVVIDDTDVKKMTRVELKDKLRAIILGMGFDAGNLTGIKKHFNIQVYILTDFWEYLKEASPVIFTLLRDGVPFYDRGVFMPWKQLLRLGKIKPSPEAIDLYMSTGEQMIKRVKKRIQDIGMEDLFYALLSPSQAAIMLYGLPPPTPKETPSLLREVFVKKEKLLSESDVKILENTIAVRKDIEHGTRKMVTGKDIDQLIENAEKYLKRLKRLFTQIEAQKDKESIVHLYETSASVVRDVLKFEGRESLKEDEIEEVFKNELVATGKVPERLSRMLSGIVKAKRDFDAGKLVKSDIDKSRKNGREFIRSMVEYLQRARGRELEKAKIRVKHGETYGEVTMLEDTAFIIHDIDASEKEISSAPVKEDGSLGAAKKSSLEAFEKALADAKIPKRVFLKAAIFDSLKKVYGKDVEVLVTF